MAIGHTSPGGQGNAVQISGVSQELRRSQRALETQDLRLNTAPLFLCFLDPAGRDHDTDNASDQRKRSDYDSRRSARARVATLGIGPGAEKPDFVGFDRRQRWHA